MAGIYIPNMQMPNELDNIHILRDGTVAVYRRDSIDFYTAIRVPDNGRLIDADNLDFVSVSIDKRGCLSKIEAPTIIPADKEKVTEK